MSDAAYQIHSPPLDRQGDARMQQMESRLAHLEAVVERLEKRTAHLEQIVDKHTAEIVHSMEEGE